MVSAFVVYECGIGRRGIRRALRECEAQFEGVSFTEDKGWLNSQFIIKGPPRAIQSITEMLRQHQEQSRIEL